MADINKILLMGRLGTRPELKTTYGGVSACTTSLATTKKVKVNGSWQDATDWHRLVAYGEVAQTLCALENGTTIGVEGSLSYSTFKVDGMTRKVAEISVKKVFYIRAKGQRDDPTPDFVPTEESPPPPESE